MDKIDTQMRNNADGVNFAKAISSDAYDNSKLYAVGDYCIYDNKLYRCITAIESAEAFNIAKWEQTTVGEEVRQLNSNLEQVGLSDVAGGKNLCLIDKEDSNHWSYSKKMYYKGTYTVSSNNTEVNTAYIIDGWHDLPHTFTADEISNFAFQKPMSITSKCIQIEEGTVATPYEPYIPSVKMLAEEVSAQNESLDDYGLDNKFTGNLVSGRHNPTTGVYDESNEYTVCDLTKYPCTSGDNVRLIAEGTLTGVYIVWYNGSSYLSYSAVSTKDLSAIAPPNATAFTINLQNSSKISPSSVSHVGVYVGNEIDKLKSDLGGLSFSVSGTTLSITDGTNTWTLSN